MMSQEDDMNANSPKYASLTAGLLARKGEAVPAAAAFTAEAIAQHIPARRLAQEAERVLINRHPIIDETRSEDATAWQESDHEGRGAHVVAEHRDLIEQAFDKSTGKEEGVPLVDSIRQLLDRSPVDSSFDSEEAQTETLPEEMLSGDKRDLDLSDVQSLLSGELSRQELEDGSAASDLNDSDENWFEDIVSKAISEAEGQQAPGSDPEADLTAMMPASPDTESGEASLASSMFTQKMADDRTLAETEASLAPEASGPTGGCAKKAVRVRQAIKSGKTVAAGRSAMRLDPRRFIRLSLAAKKLQLTSQEVMVASLDTYLDALDEEVFSDCSCMKKGLI